MTDHNSPEAEAFFGACAEGRLLEVQEVLREASDAKKQTLLDQEGTFKPDPDNRPNWEAKEKPLLAAGERPWGGRQGAGGGLGRPQSTEQRWMDRPALGLAQGPGGGCQAAGGYGGRPRGPGQRWRDRPALCHAQQPWGGRQASGG
mmetsp:Transcript_19738/g.34129  ORF Transcript_19738/g.34129 Transcript_19738/m.34129 type:complete len:146 (+) Transcript_19738:3-440(+)